MRNPGITGVFSRKQTEERSLKMPEAGSGSLDRGVVEAFRFATHFYLFEDDPLLTGIRECLMGGDPAVAVYHVKVIKYRPDAPPSLPRVERMVYASICPHINA